MIKATEDALSEQYKMYMLEYRRTMKYWAEEPQTVEKEYTPALVDVERARAKAQGFNEALRIIAENENIILYE